MANISVRNQVKPLKDAPRILLVDDHPVARQGVRLLIEAAGDLAVCGEAPDADEAITLIPKLKPDLAIIDLSLKGKPGLELIKDLAARYEKLLMLVLSMHDENMYAERALRAGARGYIMKQEATEKILLAIRRILAGDIYVSEAIAARVLRQLAVSGNQPLKSSLDLLTDRELEIFQFLGQGKPVREIAKMLHLSTKTIEAHREHIKEKLNLASSSELLRMAIQVTMEAE
ncbi:MAG: response regulator transcription factor [Phycisphaerae bacterium]